MGSLKMVEDTTNGWNVVSDSSVCNGMARDLPHPLCGQSILSAARLQQAENHNVTQKLSQRQTPFPTPLTLCTCNVLRIQREKNACKLMVIIRALLPIAIRQQGGQ